MTAYLLALADADTITLGDKFERAFRDALSGNVLSEAEFWDQITRIGRRDR